MAYPIVGDICIVRVPFNSDVHYYGNAMANVDIGGCHLDHDNINNDWVWLHSEVVHPNTWMSLKWSLLLSGFGYEIYRLPGYMNAGACYSYWNDVMVNYATDHYRIPQWQFGSCPNCVDWDWAIAHNGNLWSIYNQKHSDQSYSDYWDISMYDYRKSYGYCISLVWDAIIHGWYVNDPSLKDIISRGHVQFYHNCMPGQQHNWLKNATQRVYY